uniref:Uncharacterized protein n=1 Tax=Avena sativa TaxID=4498 RepID=A0ACD5T7L2_AVESA
MAAEGETMGEKGRCVTCREWQEHYYWEHMDVSNIRFFKVMAADYQQRISIPENIANKVTAQIAKGAAFTLKAPSGDTWRVGVGKIGGEVFFTSGWEEFAKAHELREKDLLIFKCSGSGSFDVLIFDSSGTEKVPCFFADRERANVRRHFDDIVGQQADGGRRVLKDSGNAIVPLSQPVGSPHRASASEKPGKDDGSPNYRGSQVKLGVTEEEEQSVDEHTDSERYYYSRFASYLTADEREQIFVLASVQPGNPAYVVVLQKAHVRRGNNMLVIPSKFAADHLERKTHDVLLLRPNRKEQWSVNYYHASVTRGFNGGRWAKFVRDNGLREGYVCIFELMKGARRVTMTVHVVRKVDDGRFVLLG